MDLSKYELSDTQKQAQKEIESAQDNILTKYTPEDLKNWKTVDLYLVLGIHSLRDDTIIDKKKLYSIYKKRVMKYHPDSSEFPQQVYFLVQKAYSVIGDPTLRRQYDSMIFVDDFVEDKIYDEVAFFETFANFFRRYAKFSKNLPVPNFGDLRTPKNEVCDFYKFWSNFESWRTFEMVFVEDTIMNRYEKRTAEKANKSKIQKMKNDEILRIKRIVGIAMKRDPRLNEIKKIEVDKRLLNGGWTEEEIVALCELNKEVGMGVKNRFEVIAKRFWEMTGKKKSSKEIFIKCNQIGNK